jgi:hypothetical protein
MDIPGTPVTTDDLRGLGFQRHNLHVRCASLPAGPGCEWDTLGDVPKTAGLYAFTVEDDVMVLRVVYVGMTTHLWMVTIGSLPNGGGHEGRSVTGATPTPALRESESTS